VLSGYELNNSILLNRELEKYTIAGGPSPNLYLSIHTNIAHFDFNFNFNYRPRQNTYVLYCIQYVQLQTEYSVSWTEKHILYIEVDNTNADKSDYLATLYKTADSGRTKYNAAQV
jgi:hypothetical protein